MLARVSRAVSLTNCDTVNAWSSGSAPCRWPSCCCSRPCRCPWQLVGLVGFGGAGARLSRGLVDRLRHCRIVVFGLRAVQVAELLLQLRASLSLPVVRFVRFGGCWRAPLAQCCCPVAALSWRGLRALRRATGRVVAAVVRVVGAESSVVLVVLARVSHAVSLTHSDIVVAWATGEFVSVDVLTSHRPLGGRATQQRHAADGLSSQLGVLISTPALLPSPQLMAGVVRHTVSDARYHSSSDVVAVFARYARAPAQPRRYTSAR